MATHEYRLDFTKNETYECGAVLLSLLIYPEDDEEDSCRADLHASLCATLLKAKFEETPDEHLPQFIRPCHAFREQKQIKKDLKKLPRLLRDRMIAGHMAIAFLKEAATGQTPKLPQGIARLSINQMALVVLEAANQSVPENVETRIWRPSIPVIHLAAAAAVMMDVYKRAGFGTPDIGHLLSCRELIEAIVREAQVYETLIEKSPRLRIDPTQLIKLRLVTH